MRLIDADAFKLYVQRCILIDEDLSTEQIERYLLAAIDAFPEIDAESVVRCKDCEYHDRTTGICKQLSERISISRNKGAKMKPYDFCSYGERREK